MKYFELDGFGMKQAAILGSVWFVSCTLMNIWWKESTRRKNERIFAETPELAWPFKDPILGFLKERSSPEYRYRLNELWRESLDKYPNARLFYFRTMIMDPIPPLFTKDPEIVKYILVDAFDRYSKPNNDGSNSFTSLFRDWVGDGIFAAPHGEEADDKGMSWKVQRQTASKMFTRNAFRTTMQDTFVRKGHVLCNVIGGDQQGGQAKHPTEANVMDFQSLVLRYSMDSVLSLFFGVEADTISGSMDEYARAFDQVQTSMFEYFGKNFKYVLLFKIFPWPFGNSAYGLLERMVRFFSPDARKFYECVDIMNQYARRIIEERKKIGPQPDQHNMLSFFMDNLDLNAVGITDEDAKIQFLSNVILSLVLAGRDTTAITLTWCLFELSRNPEIQQKLQQEIDSVLPNLQEPVFEDVHGSKLPYLNGVIYESLRLWPPVPNDNKVAQQDDILPNGQFVPKGTRITFFVYGMGRDKKIWGEDVLEFKPERWIPFKNPTGANWPVFQLGPRRCLGEQMALMEAKVVLIMLMQRFSVKLLEGEEKKIRPSNNLTLSLCNSENLDSGNLWLRVSKR